MPLDRHMQRVRRMRRVCTSPWAKVLSVAVIAVIGTEVRRRQSTPLDRHLVVPIGVKERGSARASYFAEPLRLLVEAGVIAALVPGLARRERAMLVAAPLTAVAAGEGLKWLVPRERPNKDRFTPQGGKSFPSTHAACATAFALAAAAVAHRHGAGGRWTYGAALVLGTWIGVERVRDAAHWPTDALAGIALGVFSSALVADGA